MISKKKLYGFSIVFSFIGVVASSQISGTVNAVYPDVMGCESGCIVTSAGWPFPYLVDYPGISPVGSVSLIDAVLGIDRLQIVGLLTDLVVWCCIGNLLAGICIKLWNVQRLSNK
jgi:hypothetical protein